MPDSAFGEVFASCGLKFTPKSLIIEAPNKDAAFALLNNQSEFIASQSKRLGLADTRICYDGCRRPLVIPAKMAPSDITEGTGGHVLNSYGVLDSQLDLLGADYVRILDLLKQCHDEGLIVIITSNTTDICLHTSPTLTPKRAHWNASKFHGYNYLNSWRKDRHSQPVPDRDQLNPEYGRLKDLLARDGSVPGYEYSLFRPDGALVRYETTYYLCREYCGDEIRIGISRPQDYTVLEEARAMNLA